MLRVLVLILLVPVATACGVAQSPGSSAAESSDGRRDAASSRFTASFVDRGEPFTVIGAIDYEQGTAIIGEAGTEPNIITPEATFELLTGLGYDPDETGGRRWLKSDPISVSDELAPVFAPFADSPSELLGFIHAIGHIETVKSETVQRNGLIRYRARLDLDRVLNAFPEAGPSVRESLVRCWPDSKTAGPVDFAVDTSGRLRVVNTTFSCKRPIELTIEFFDYGLGVDAKAPPTDEVMTHEELDRLDEQMAQEEQ
jgi:hypothetical protein